MVTADDIEVMLRRYKEDLAVFETAKNALGRRMADLEVSDPEHYDNFVKWPATQVVANGLILCISKCMGVIEDLEKHLTTRTVVKLVEDEPGDEDDDVR